MVVTVSVIVRLVVLGTPFSSETSWILFYFFHFFWSFSCQFFVLVVFVFVYLQWHTGGAEIKVPCVENPEL